MVMVYEAQSTSLTDEALGMRAYALASPASTSEQ